jgi:hypothetical protein
MFIIPERFEKNATGLPSCGLCPESQSASNEDCRSCRYKPIYNPLYHRGSDARACLKARHIPSPVIGSTVPDASPIRAMLPLVTPRSFLAAANAPRSRVLASAPFKRVCSIGNCPRALEDTQLRLTRHQHDANFACVDRRYIELRSPSPMYLHVLGPRRDPIVPPVTEPLAVANETV